MLLLFQLLDFALMILQIVIFVQVIASWLISFNVVSPHNPTVRGLLNGLDRITLPFYRPIRSILPDFGPLDLSPLVLLLIVSFLRGRVLPALEVSLLPEAM